MRINEKNLCAYAVSSSVTADKEGFLMKKGEVNKGFQRRWFVLKGNLLFYFEKQYDREPVGVIILEGCTIELDENDHQFSFKIVFHGAGNRNYILCAESHEAMEQWMKTLACASYDFLKLMVIELQRQLKETRKADKIPIEKVSENDADSSPLIICTENEFDLVENTSKMLFSTPSSSPHPPPRNRPRPQISQSTFKTKVSISTGAGNNPIKNTSRVKISFNNLHTSLGRPILRDRNLWRYNKKSENTSVTLAVTQFRQIPEQNLLISL